MEHVAIMKKSWGLTEKILTGAKKIESRWYKNKHTPWNRIKSGEIVYFKCYRVNLADAIATACPDITIRAVQQVGNAFYFERILCIAGVFYMADQFIAGPDYHYTLC